MIFLVFFGFSAFAQSPVLLSESQIYEDSMKSGEYKYFYSYISKNKNIDIVVQPIYGDTDLFVILVDNDKDPTKFPMPNPNFYNFSSMTSVMLESVHISSSKLDYCTKNCSIKISVLCLSSECAFDVYFDQGSYIFLTNNRPIQGWTEKEAFAYFRYLRTDDKPLMILLTVLGSSNPDLYVAKDSKPGLNNATWSSSTLGGETLIISDKDKGLYFIGVYCDTKSEFTILLTSEIDPIYPLYSGLPQYIYNEIGTRSNFYFWSASDENLQIKVSVLAGKIFLVANAQNPENQEMYERLPTKEFYTWASFDTKNDQSSITILNTDSRFCKDCNIIISVFALSNSEYTIVGTNEQYLEILQNGVPSHGILSKNKLDSYIFVLDSLSDIEIKLVVYSGNANVYVDTKTPVASNYFRWRSSTWYDVEVVQILKTDKDWVLGTYYIAVHAVQLSSYSIIVVTKNTPIFLIPGLQYEFLLEKPVNFILNQRRLIPYSCVIVSFHEEFKPFVYINTNKTLPVLPTPTNNQLSYTSPLLYDSTLNSFTFELLTQTDSVSAIGIYPNLVVREPFFSFVCMNSDSVTKLKQHSYNFLVLKEDSMEFELYAESNQPITITLQFCKGKFNLFVSKNHVNYDQDPNTEILVLSDKIVAVINNPIGRYYLKVFGLVESCFELFTESGQTDFSLDPGKEISYVFNNNQFLVSWGKALINGKISDVKLEYYVYYSYENRKELYNACALKILEKENLITKIGPVVDTNLVINENKNIYLNVVVFFTRHRQSTQGYAVYQPIAMETSYEEESKGHWVYFIVFPVSVFIIVLAVIRYRKRKVQLRNREFELSGY